MSEQFAELVRIVNEQAEDPNLWRIYDEYAPVTLHEELLQAALRRLHRVIEGGSDFVVPKTHGVSDG